MKSININEAQDLLNKIKKEYPGIYDRCFSYYSAEDIALIRPEQFNWYSNVVMNIDEILNSREIRRPIKKSLLEWASEDIHKYFEDRYEHYVSVGEVMAGYERSKKLIGDAVKDGWMTESESIKAQMLVDGWIKSMMTTGTRFNSVMDYLNSNRMISDDVKKKFLKFHIDSDFVYQSSVINQKNRSAEILNLVGKVKADENIEAAGELARLFELYSDPKDREKITTNEFLKKLTKAAVQCEKGKRLETLSNFAGSISTAAALESLNHDDEIRITGLNISEALDRFIKSGRMPKYTDFAIGDDEANSPSQASMEMEPEPKKPDDGKDGPDAPFYQMNLNMER